MLRSKTTPANVIYTLSLTLLLAGIWLRVAGLHFLPHEGDPHTFVRYITMLRDQSFCELMSQHFSKISTGFLYLWYPLTLLGNDQLYEGVKYCSFLFDYLCAFWCYRIVWLKHAGRPHLPWLAAALCSCLPVTIFTSSLWGQVDSIYVSFLLGCLYFLMRMQTAQAGTYDNLHAVTMFSIAFCLKLQSVFMIPALCLLVAARRLHWLYGAVPIAAYSLMQLPRFACGYPLSSLFRGYYEQTQAYQYLSVRAPNPYLILRQYVSPYIQHIADMAGIAAGPLLCLMALYLGYRLKKVTLRAEHILLLCTLSVTLSVYCITRMHERYFFAACMFMLLLPFYLPRLWLPALLVNLAVPLCFIPHWQYKFPFHVDFIWPVVMVSISLAWLLYAAATSLDQHQKRVSSYK